MLLALDVGFESMGWAIMNGGKPCAAGVIHTEKSAKKTTRVADDYAHRVAILAGGLADVVRKYKPTGVVAELPSGGAQSASAMAKMNMATAVVSTFVTLLRMPAEWVSPTESKKALTGLRDAPKRSIMEKIVEIYGGKIISKSVKCRATKNYPDGCREDRKYEMCGAVFPEGTFEHIADAMAAYYCQRFDNLVKLYG